MPSVDGWSRVEESALWTLYQRATAAAAPHSTLIDPMAIDLLSAIEFPCRDRFGPASRVSALHSLHVSRLDDALRRQIQRMRGYVHVISLGEGLDTQFWRVDDGKLRWTTVDLPNVIDLRTRLIAPHERCRLIASSVQDIASWMPTEELDAVVVLAKGILMYLAPAEVRAIAAACRDTAAVRALIFDAVPHWFARTVGSGRARIGDGWQVPPMPWSVGPSASHVEGDLAVAVRRLHFPRQGKRESRFAGLLNRWPLSAQLPLGAFVAEWGDELSATD